MRATVRARRRAGVRPSRRARLRLAPAIVLVTAASGVAAAPAHADAVGAPAQACAGADAAPDGESSVILRRAVRCIVNNARSARGLPVLRRSRRLGRAAAAHAADMVANHYFAHERPGWTLTSRLRSVGWTRDAGEAIAFGCGGLGTPAAVVSSWMTSPPHLAILLSATFRRVGIGLAVGSPVTMPCTAAGTWVLDAG
jgi:uncharacterized protein YkwD